jgi:hypothetical protein
MPLPPSLPPSLSHTQHDGVVVRLIVAAPSIALAARCGGAVFCTRAAINRTHGAAGAASNTPIS